MDIESQAHQNPLLQSLIEGYFISNNALVRLTLCNDSFYFSSQKSASPIYLITFDCSYDIAKDNSGQILTISTSQQTFKFFSYAKLDYWQEKLSKVMRRRRFHQFYRGVSKLGKGNFACVYLTERVKDRKLFAVKAFNKRNIVKTTKGKQALDNQINLLRKLKHPNIAYLQSVNETQNSIYLVMEFIQGKSLGQILDQQKGGLAPSIRKKIMKGLLSGLAEMAAHNIVHRDIKPENIMIDHNGQTKIVDFGLATSTTIPRYLYTRCGTPGFVAPQIIAMKDNDHVQMVTVSDVFSAGAIFYHMIFGKPLFDGEKNQEIIKKNRAFDELKLTFNSNLMSLEQFKLLKSMLDIYPSSRITASQALCTGYFSEKRQPLQQRNSYTADKKKNERLLSKLKQKQGASKHILTHRIKILQQKSQN